jgi:hypothetical protein
MPLQRSRDRADAEAGKAPQLLLPSQAAVRLAYRRLAVLLHPDKCNLPEAAAAFGLVRRAYAAANRALSDAAAAAAAAINADGDVGAATVAAMAAGATDRGDAQQQDVQLEQQQQQQPEQEQKPALAGSKRKSAADGAAADAAADAGPPAAPVSNRNRLVSISLQLDGPLLDVLQLPANFLPPTAPGDPQQPLLLLVEVPRGKLAAPP